MHLFTPLILSLTLLSITVTAKNCTHDPFTYLNHPLAYLAAHPILTLKLDELCHAIRHFNHVISDLNTTLGATHPKPDLNATQISNIVANASAELDILQANATLVRLCARAEEVVDECWPLVYDEWRVHRPECRAAPLANQTAEAGKNGTLVDLCKKFVDGCNKNETVTDAGKEVFFFLSLAVKEGFEIFGSLSGGLMR
jgi:hypothetical protein